MKPNLLCKKFGLFMVLLWMALSVKATAQMGAGGLLPGYIRGTGFPERYHPVPIPGETDGERRLH